MNEIISPSVQSSSFSNNLDISHPTTFIEDKVILGRRGLERLDLLLLVVEAIDMHGSQAMIFRSEQLGLNKHFPNVVELWKYRCHNPLRKTSRRGTLKPIYTNSLILLICSMSERVYPLLRQLLSSQEPLDLNQQRWDLVTIRLKELIGERLNMRRGAVQRLVTSHESKTLLRQLVLTLALSVGEGGIDRLRASLVDPAP